MGRENTYVKKGKIEITFINRFSPNILFRTIWPQTFEPLYSKKRLAYFLSPAGMSLTKLSRRG